MTIKPQITINGTSTGELLEQLIDALQALDLAKKALGRAAPNGRDYAALGSRVFGQVQQDHADRIKRLDDTIAELSEIAESL